MSNLISKFKVRCKNEGCGKTFEAGKQLKEHEMKCSLCPDCKTTCPKCHNIHLFGEDHECPEPPPVQEQPDPLVDLLRNLGN